MTRRIVVIGGGHGIASVLHAMRPEGAELTVVVTVADDGGSSGELRRRGAGPAVGDLRRSLVALTGDEVPLGRAFRRPVTVNGLGRHPLGNLMILSIADAFGDLPRATEWLGERLGIQGTVLPATAVPVSLVADVDGELIHGESAIGVSPTRIRRLHFNPERPAIPGAVLEAIDQADFVLLAPGSLFTSVLAATALPDVASALTRTEARVVWICNLEADMIETAGMAGIDHLTALEDHGVRVDVALYDPRASLKFEAQQLAEHGIEPRPRSLEDGQRGKHDPALLRAELRALFADAAGTAGPGGQSPLSRGGYQQTERLASRLRSLRIDMKPSLLDCRQNWPGERLYSTSKTALWAATNGLSREHSVYSKHCSSSA
jgi:uncharacterized cofD-like protein